MVKIIHEYGSPAGIHSAACNNVVLCYVKIYIDTHDDVIKWKHFPRYWPFVRGIHRSPVNSPHKGQWRGALMFSLICAWINDWVNNREAGVLRQSLWRHCNALHGFTRSCGKTFSRLVNRGPAGIFFIYLILLTAAQCDVRRTINNLNVHPKLKKSISRDTWNITRPLSVECTDKPKLHHMTC